VIEEKSRYPFKNRTIALLGKIAVSFYEKNYLPFDERSPGPFLKTAIVILRTRAMVLIRKKLFLSGKERN
jgi:hypothetical protein